MHNKMPYVYLVQCSYFKDDVFKIGGSKKIENDRLKSYGKGTKILAMIVVNGDYREVENQIKVSFNSKFTLVHGREYFQGNEDEIKLEFLKIVYSYQLNKKTTVEAKVDMIINDTVVEAKVDMIVNDTVVEPKVDMIVNDTVVESKVDQQANGLKPKSNTGQTPKSNKDRQKAYRERLKAKVGTYEFKKTQASAMRIYREQRSETTSHRTFVLFTEEQMHEYNTEHNVVNDSICIFCLQLCSTRSTCCDRYEGIQGYYKDNMDDIRLLYACDNCAHQDNDRLFDENQILMMPDGREFIIDHIYRMND